MKPPILTFEGHDLIVFGSVEAAERFVEPPDVRVMRTYDADGRLLRFEADGRRTLLRERESEPSHQQDLRAALLDVFEQTGAPADQDTPLPDLVEQAVALFSHPKRRRPERR